MRYLFARQKGDSVVKRIPAVIAKREVITPVRQVAPVIAKRVDNVITPIAKREVITPVRQVAPVIAKRMDDVIATVIAKREVITPVIAKREVIANESVNVTPKKESDMPIGLTLGAIAGKLLPVAAKGIGKLFGKKKAKGSASVGAAALGNVMANAKVKPLDIAGNTRTSPSSFSAQGSVSDKSGWWSSLPMWQKVLIIALPGGLLLIGILVLLFKRKRR